MSLFKIQHELKAPKGQTNAFGKYKYRSCEDIVEAVKPILNKYETSLILTDTIELIGDRYYVKATAKLIGEGINESVSAYAREPIQKKGMDEAQVTGATSSYARKYALNGLFAIDDTKDADTMDNSTPPPVMLVGKRHLNEIEKLIQDTNSDRAKLLSFFKVSSLEDAPYESVKNSLISKLQKAS